MSKIVPIFHIFLDMRHLCFVKYGQFPLTFQIVIVKKQTEKPSNFLINEVLPEITIWGSFSIPPRTAWVRGTLLWIDAKFP